MNSFSSSYFHHSFTDTFYFGSRKCDLLRRWTLPENSERMVAVVVKYPSISTKLPNALPR